MRNSGDLIPEDDSVGGLQASALGEGEVFGIEAVLEGVGVTGLGAV